MLGGELCRTLSHTMFSVSSLPNISSANIKAKRGLGNELRSGLLFVISTISHVKYYYNHFSQSFLARPIFALVSATKATVSLQYLWEHSNVMIV